MTVLPFSMSNFPSLRRPTPTSQNCAQALKSQFQQSGSTLLSRICPWALWATLMAWPPFWPTGPWLDIGFPHHLQMILQMNITTKSLGNMGICEFPTALTRYFIETVCPVVISYTLAVVLLFNHHELLNLSRNPFVIHTTHLASSIIKWHWWSRYHLQMYSFCCFTCHKKTCLRKSSYTALGINAPPSSDPTAGLPPICPADKPQQHHRIWRRAVLMVNNT